MLNSGKPKRGVTVFTVKETGDTVYFDRITENGGYFCRTTEKNIIDQQYEVFRPSQLQLYVKPRTKVNQVSDTQKKRNRIYATIRKIFLENNPFCQAKLKGCTVRSTQVHHMMGRIGDLLFKIKHFLAVCDNCHKKIEASPEEAKKLNLSKDRL